MLEKKYLLIFAFVYTWTLARLHLISCSRIANYAEACHVLVSKVSNSSMVKIPHSVLHTDPDISQISYMEN